MKTTEDMERFDKSALNIVIADLKDAREYAIVAGLDHHFVSEIDHLIATAEANKEGVVKND